MDFYYQDNREFPHEWLEDAVKLANEQSNIDFLKTNRHLSSYSKILNHGWQMNFWQKPCCISDVWIYYRFQTILRQGDYLSFIYAPDDLWLNYWRLIFLVLKRIFTDKMWSDSILTQLFLFLLQIYISSRYRLFSRYQYQPGLKSHRSIPGSCWALAKSWCFSHFGVFFLGFVDIEEIEKI